MLRQDLFDHLSEYVSDHKHSLFDKNLPNRTKYVTVVLENIFQPHNASAVVRSADCFGVQDVHVIENDNEYTVSRDVVKGASKWIDIHRYSEKENNTIECINELKSKGYRIVATSPHSNDCNLHELDLSKGPVALLFGSEEPGLSDLALEHADEFVKIPMYGFTESFNISVSAALCMYELTTKLHNSEINWKLSEDEQKEVRYRWMKKVIKSADQIEKIFLERN